MLAEMHEQRCFRFGGWGAYGSFIDWAACSLVRGKGSVVGTRERFRKK